MKKVEKILTQKDVNSNNIIGYLSKKCITSNNTSWEKIIEKGNNKSSLVYFFISKNDIFGGFHADPIKIEDKSIISDSESGIFITNRQ